MIEIKNFSKSYPSVPLYENFNLTLGDGEVTCILGESGSGKTTLLNAIAGVIGYSGFVTRVKCSYIFQTPRLVPNLTVKGNLSLVCKDAERVNAMLERVKLKEKADSFPNKLSGGQAQRVAIARAFLFDGDAILMDEPFSSLDLKLKAEMTELFFDIWSAEKKTTVFVTHDVDEAVSIAHRIIVIDRGRAVYDRAVGGEPPRGLGTDEKLRSELVSVLMKS